MGVGGEQVKGRGSWRGWPHAALGLCLALFGCGGGANGVNPGTSVGAQVPDPLQSASLLANGAAPLTPPGLVVAMDDNEALGPFSSWADAQRDYGAKGDGVADDTAALQKALDDLGPKKPALYLPAGRYRITHSLLLKGSPASGGFGLGGVALMGNTPETTQIIWAGPAGDPMLVQDGGFNSRYSRITWDGQGTAGYGVAHWWNATAGTQFDGSPEHTDEIFKDMKIGIMAGRLGANYGQLNSEGQVRRVRFLRMSQAGVNTGSWNALDWWVWDSRFTDCARGVSNYFTVGDAPNPGPGAGAVHVYRSLFERSTYADVHIANTGFFSMQHNVSVGSKRFFEGGGVGSNGASILIQGNRVIDSTDAAAIVNGNLGPLVLLDNEIRSLPGNTSAAVMLFDWAAHRDVVSIGNRYTVSNPVKVVDSTDRLFTQDDTLVDRSAISAALPGLPGTPSRPARHVYEVPPGTNTPALQAIVNLAAQSGDVSPVVHLAAGIHTVTRTIVLPAGVRLQIVGDGLLTQLNWAGPNSGIMFQLDGPSLASIRDMQVVALAPSARFVSMSNANQPGGRLYVQGSAIGKLSTAKLPDTQITMQANTGISGMDLSGAGSVVSMGAGGIGPVVIRDGSHALFSDTWFEGVDTRLYTLQSGQFTYLNGHMAPAAHAGASDLTQAAINLDGFQGRATFLSFSVDASKIVGNTAIRVRDETSATQALFLAAASGSTSFLDRTGSAGGVGLIMGRGNDGTGPVPVANQGRSDAPFLRDMLTQARALQWDTAPHVAPAGATDVHIYRVHGPQTLGVLVSGS